ncbi:MAG: DNA repair protein RadC [Planctomycetota bacterium]|nr:DNA repair protein RadC [Planctomycetota bacterium]
MTPVCDQVRGRTGKAVLARGCNGTEKGCAGGDPPWGELLGPAGELAEELAGRWGLVELSRWSAAELRRAGGLAPAASRRLAAAFALGRAVERDCGPHRVPLRSAEAVYRLMAPELRGLRQETFHTLLLDTKHRLGERIRVSAGTLSTSLVHPREVFGPAVRGGAAAIIVVHNHPSGDPKPSPEDQEVTRRLLRAGQLLGIPLLDHLVVGNSSWASLRETMDFVPATD